MGVLKIKKKKASYVSGRFFLSSRFCTRRRNQTPGLDTSPRCDRGWCCSRRCLQTLQARGIYCKRRHIKRTNSFLCVEQRHEGRSRHSLISQWSPSQPSPQMHWYTLTLSMQVPPLRHGLLSQSLMSGMRRRRIKKNKQQTTRGTRGAGFARDSDSLSWQ